MKCIFCGYDDSKVIDSRSSEDGNAIRRRRECLQCGKRFTTYETIEDTVLLVVKNNGTRQAYDENKVRNGIIKACEKRPVSSAKIEQMVNFVSRTVYNTYDREVPSHEIGELVMAQLKDADEVAYVRYASVYRKFTDVSSFMEELQKLIDNKEAKK
ncbi:MAG: transcriptional regulator NrdR [Clostridia bacterium]|nr:transcriptional regulator NrdR [Clostridia bacterium]